MAIRALVLLILSSSACALPMVGDVSHVEILDSRDRLAGECQFLMSVNAIDGANGEWRYAYEGTEERALMRLRWEADQIRQTRRARATHLVLTEGPIDRVFAIADGPQPRGREVFVRADAYSCALESKCRGENCRKSGAQFLQEQLERAEREDLAPSLEVNQ